MISLASRGGLHPSVRTKRSQGSQELSQARSAIAGELGEAARGARRSGVAQSDVPTQTPDLQPLPRGRLGSTEVNRRRDQRSAGHEVTLRSVQNEWAGRQSSAACCARNQVDFVTRLRSACTAQGEPDHEQVLAQGRKDGPAQNSPFDIEAHLSRSVQLVEHATPRRGLVEDGLKRAHGLLLGQIEAELVLDLRASVPSKSLRAPSRRPCRARARCRGCCR